MSASQFQTVGYDKLQEPSVVATEPRDIPLSESRRIPHEHEVSQISAWNINTPQGPLFRDRTMILIRIICWILLIGSTVLVVLSTQNLSESTEGLYEKIQYLDDQTRLLEEMSFPMQFYADRIAILNYQSSNIPPTGAGFVVGPNGPRGLTGKDGKPGDPGLKGQPGATGEPGLPYDNTKYDIGSFHAFKSIYGVLGAYQLVDQRGTSLRLNLKNYGSVPDGAYLIKVQVISRVNGFDSSGTGRFKVEFSTKVGSTTHMRPVYLYFEKKADTGKKLLPEVKYSTESLILPYDSTTSTSLTVHFPTVETPAESDISIFVTGYI